MEFSALSGDKGIEFKFKHENVNGLLQLIVWEEGAKDILWDVNLNYYTGDTLKYGEIPIQFITFNGVKNSAKQNYPINNIAPIAVPVGSIIYVYISYQYDTFISPASSSHVYSLQVGENGIIVNKGIVPFPKSGERPKVFD